MTGIAVGCIGMGLEDFCRCTPSEFNAVYTAWKNREEMRERGAWERMRMQCMCALQPYSKKTLTAHDIMRFPWEREPHKQEESGRPTVENRQAWQEPTREELMERYRAAKRRFGLK